MTSQVWAEALLPPEDPEQLWELFHENSKIGRHWQGLPKDDIVERMKGLRESLAYTGYPVVELPRRFVPMKRSLATTILTRETARPLRPCVLTLRQVATLLHYAYGVTRDNEGTPFVRPFRVVPSGGGLYPLELYMHSAHVEGLRPGLYHYNASGHVLRRLRTGDETDRIAQATPYPELATGAAMMVFITALFERSVFKYGDRGYRFALLEAGHVAQNLNLTANGLQLGTVNIGGFFDREIDEWLGLDGVTHSTIYIGAIGDNASRRRRQTRPAPKRSR